MGSLAVSSTCELQRRPEVLETSGLGAEEVAESSLLAEDSTSHSKERERAQDEQATSSDNTPHEELEDADDERSQCEEGKVVSEMAVAVAVPGCSDEERKARKAAKKMKKKEKKRKRR